MGKDKKPVLGVIGGLGPIATAYFMELVIRMTDAHVDQEHLDMIIYNLPSIPDRTEFIMGESSCSPLPGLIQVGKALAEQNVNQIAIPCMTAHFFYKEMQQAISAPVINCPLATAQILKDKGIKKAGIMATDGTRKARLFARELDAVGIEPVFPSAEGQKRVMHLIYEDIKANQPADMHMFRSVSRELRQNGAEAIILGCTELSLIKRDFSIGNGYLDAMEVLAQQSILLCGGRLKANYQNLFFQD